MASSNEDSEVACYVLAYLLRENYSETANCFLKECRVLPTGTLLVLPQASLKTVVSEHKARHDSLVLMNTLGNGSAYQALWAKLNKTLQQMKCLHEQLLSNQTATPLYRTAAGVRSKGRANYKQSKSLVTTAPTAASGPTPSISCATSTSVPQQLATPSASLLVPGPHQLTSPQKSQAPPIPSSPHRRKPVPKRKLQSSGEFDGAGPSYAPPSSPTMHQILETFLEDDYLPGKLADIINKCVDSDCELSTTTLDSILSMTQLEPAFEGLLPGHGHGPAQRSATASNQTGSQLPTPDSPPSTVHTPTASTLHSSVTAQQPQTDHESVGMVQLGGDEPSSKRLKLASDDHDGLNHFPTDKDIDDFLDQLHQ